MLHRLSLLLLLLCSVSVAPATLRVYGMRAWGIRNDPVGYGDGYVKVYYNGRIFGTTGVQWDDPHPEWKEYFTYSKASSGNQLILHLYDKGTEYDDLLGVCMITVKTGSQSFKCPLSTEGRLDFTYSLR